MPLDFVLHHIGIAVPDLEAAAARYQRLYGYETTGEIFQDPVQGARVQFLRLRGQTERLELVTPLGPESQLHGALTAKRRLNHLCYSVADLDAACERLRHEGLFMIHAPVVAVAFRPRRITWFMDRDGIPIELVERTENSPSIATPDVP